ncbi:putative sigma-54 modulation protein [Cohnella sp. OV330]|uniref:ribosome hibernation-promoting factor, HPF/YfiA family n=1 Tax=Cohnella sp. OV330 TaxID=1855288 RepID=UPI0008E5536B|nr:ribosome-associated translation inhibitor RaiA [Cohnella sp. OV330]SFB48021.1 putative sigma-54 modulation protein [Cohnella sp. OV330]
MKYNIRGQRMEVTPALRDYVEKKLARLERYFEAPPQTDGNVTLSVTKGSNAVEVTLPLQGLLLRAEEKSNDMYASIDLVVDKLERQIRKHKTKVNRKIRQTAGAKGVFKEENASSNATATLVREDEDEKFEVVRTKRFLSPPMAIEDAILEMNLIGHNFFVFANAETKETNVVYRRDDGTYGLIESAV